MNNLKKIGLSALAGSLVAASASAGALDVTGIWEVTFKSDDNANSGNAFGSKSAIMFNGSGDVDGVGTASWYAAMNDNNPAGFLSHKVDIDMGDLGTFGFDQGVGAYGVGTIDDKMPYAYEELWNHTGSVRGLRAAGGTNAIGYKNAYNGYNLSVEIDPGHGAGSANGDSGSTGEGTTDSGYNFAVTTATLYEGLDAGFGYGTEEATTDSSNAKDASFVTGYVTYAIGGATLGFQMSDASGGATGAIGNQVMIAGVSYSVNENLAVSFSKMENEYANGTSLTAASGTVTSQAIGVDTTEDTTGLGASYTMGSAAVRLLASQGTSIGGTAGNDEDHIELSLMLAF